MGIEPTFEAWEAPVLPLNYTRDKCLIYRDSYHCVMGIPRTFDTTRGVPPLAPLRGQRGYRSAVPVRTVHGCTGTVKHRDVRKRPPGELVEPTLEALEAPVLPLHYTRLTAGVRECTCWRAGESPPAGKGILAVSPAGCFRPDLATAHRPGLRRRMGACPRC